MFRQKTSEKMISVTEALSPFSPFNNPDRYIPDGVLERAAQRGSRVHRACAAFSMELPVMCLKTEDIGYFESFKKWFEPYVMEVLLVEKRLESPLGFYGHPDLVCMLINEQIYVVDYKTPAVESPVWKSQIAAYSALAEEELGIKVDNGMALVLDASGKSAKGIVYQRRAEDYVAFLSALNAYRYFIGGKTNG